MLSVLEKYGLPFHLVEASSVSLVKWVKETSNEVPVFGTHQIRIVAVVCRNKQKDVLVIKEKNSAYKGWKLPTGVSNLNEDIGDAAVREVFEETGIKANFLSIVSFWQRHEFPLAFGRSDLLFLCRLQLEDENCHHFFPCPDEIDDCAWMKPNELVKTPGMLSSDYQRLIMNLLNKGFLESNFLSSEMVGRPLSTIYTKKSFQLFLPLNYWEKL